MRMMGSGVCVELFQGVLVQLVTTGCVCQTEYARAVVVHLDRVMMASIIHKDITMKQCTYMHEHGCFINN